MNDKSDKERTVKAETAPSDDAESAAPVLKSLDDVKRAVGSRALPVLATSDIVLFPFATLPFSIEGARVALVDDAMKTDRLLVVVTWRDAEKQEPTLEDLYSVGTLAAIVRVARMGAAHVHVLLRGLGRVRLDEAQSDAPFLRARVSFLDDQSAEDVEAEGLGRAVQDQFEKLVELSTEMPKELGPFVRSLQPLGTVADFVAALTDLSLEEKQELLEELSVKERLRLLARGLGRQLAVLEMGKKIQADVRGTLDEQQKQFLLRKQLEAIQKELGETDDTARELGELEQNLEAAKLPEAVQKEAARELSRLAKIPAQSPEHTVVRTYLEWLGDLPWAVATEDNLDLLHARAVLDEDHAGLERIKDRILEYLAVRRFKPDAPTPILCFVGPPGTGKTSLGRSIARALGRNFVRQSLGGVRDEAEIRGHRRTYVGALPGNIVQGIRRAGSNNPLFVLDETDKLGSDFRGDPASALLEVLDPEQNANFVDHYLDVPFDLSRVLFVCTANLLDPVPPALRDRMEVIALSGYTEQEKLVIARRHLIPKALRDSGLETLGLEVTDAAVHKVIREYTSEAGLRNLNRELSALLRRTAKKIAEGKDAARTLGDAEVRELLGPERFPFERVRALDAPGAALGLAWTPAGGEVLVIEAAAMPGRRELLLTGKLGDVMKESAFAALSYVRSHARELAIDPDVFERTDVHVHVPAGAIAKDGPSAGAAICTALVSLFTGRRAAPKTAMTGEITLRGRVLAVGGIKEKLLAAHRAGLTRVVLPADNQKDLVDIPEEVRAELTIIPVDQMDRVLEAVLLPPEASADDSPKKSEPGAGGDERRAAPAC